MVWHRQLQVRQSDQRGDFEAIEHHFDGKGASHPRQLRSDYENVEEEVLEEVGEGKGQTKICRLMRLPDSVKLHYLIFLQIQQKKVIDLGVVWLVFLEVCVVEVVVDVVPDVA